MEENMEKISAKDVSMKWGLISGIVGVAFYLVLVLTDLIFTPGFSYIGLLFFGIVLYLAFKEYKDQGDTFMSLGEALKIGVLISLIGGIILAVFNFVYSEYVDPTLIERTKDMLIEQYETQGMTDDQIEQAMGFSEYMFNPYLGLVLVLLKNIFVGFVLSLILGAFMKNNNPELDV